MSIEKSNPYQKPENPENRNEQIRYFKIDESSVVIEKDKDSGKLKFYNMHATPIDGRVAGAMGSSLTGPIESLKFEVRQDLPEDGLFIDEINEPARKGEEYKLKILASSDDVLEAFLAQHGLKK